MFVKVQNEEDMSSKRLISRRQSSIATSRFPICQNMAGHFDTSAAYKAALDLVLKGLEQPSGYTEPLLHAWRLKVKAAA